MRWRSVLIYLFLGYAGAALGLTGVAFLVEITADNGRADFVATYKDMAILAVSPGLLSTALVIVLRHIPRVDTHVENRPEDYSAKPKGWWLDRRKKFIAGLAAGLIAGLVAFALSMAAASSGPFDMSDGINDVTHALTPDLPEKTVAHLQIIDKCKSYFPEQTGLPNAVDCQPILAAANSAERFVVALTAFSTGFVLFGFAFVGNIGLGHEQLQEDIGAPLFFHVSGANR